MYSTNEISHSATNCAEKRPRLDGIPLSHEPRVWRYSPRPEMYPYHTEATEHNKSNSRRADQQNKQALATHHFLPIICPEIFLAVRFNQKPKTVKEEETCMFPG